MKWHCVVVEQGIPRLGLDGWKGSSQFLELKDSCHPFTGVVEVSTKIPNTIRSYRNYGQDARGVIKMMLRLVI